MSPLLNLGRKRNYTLAQVLSNFLSRTKEGKAIIRAFAKDRESASAAIVAYIEQHLKEQPEFQRQIQAALGKEAGERFTTLVGAGGHVDQLINAEVVEQLEIRYYLFADSKQVITFLLGIVLIGVTTASLYWSSVQPRRMTGDFNIAVAEFSQTGNAGPKVADIVSQQVFRFLDDQAKLITFEDVQVSHKNIRVISSAEEAKALAKRIHAQLVIYGDVTALGDEARLTPQFYIAEAFRADVSELNGQQKLAAPVSFPIRDLLDPTSIPMTLIQERTVIMTEFTKALVYLSHNNLTLAKESVDQAIRHSEAQDPFEGQEVLYLFASQITRLQGDLASAQKYVDEALKLNPNYGRAYIAQAHIYYDEGLLYQAIGYYKKAKQLPDQPFGAYINEKANLGIGNSCWVQLQYVNQNAEPDLLGSTELEQCALDNYQNVIDFYMKQKNPGTNLTEITAWAYYGEGTILEEQGQSIEAQDMYKQAVQLTTDQDLIQLIEPHLKEAKP